jgi:hypothetical protein
MPVVRPETPQPSTSTSRVFSVGSISDIIDAFPIRDFRHYAVYVSSYIKEQAAPYTGKTGRAGIRGIRL